MDWTHDRVKRELERRRGDLGPLHDEMRRDESFILASAIWESNFLRDYLPHLPKTDGGVPYIAEVPPVAADAVQLYVTQVYSGERAQVRTTLPASAHRDADKKRRHEKELNEKFGGLHWRIDTYTGQSMILTACQHMFGLGMGWLSYGVDWTQWRKHPYGGREPRNAREQREVRIWEYQRHDRLPWAIRAPHPTTVFFDVDHDPFEDVIEEREVSLAPFAGQYPHLELDPESNGTGKLVVFCSHREYGVWLNGVPLLTKKQAPGVNGDGVAPNTTGVLWYKAAFSGFGWQGGTLIEQQQGGWATKVKGNIRDARDAICMFIAAYNQIAIMRGVYAFPPTDVPAQTIGDALHAAGQIAWGPGRVFPRDMNLVGKPSPFERPSVPEWVWNEYQEQRAQLERHFGPEIMRGVYPGNETASGTATRLSQAKAPLRPGQASLAQADGAMLVDMAYMTKHSLAEPVPFMGKSKAFELTEADYMPGMRVSIDLSPPTLEEKAAEREDIMARLEAGLLSRRAAMMLTSDPDADVDEEMALIDADRAEALPAYLEAVLQAALPPPPAPPAPPAQPLPPEQDPMMQGQMGQLGGLPAGMSGQMLGQVAPDAATLPGAPTAPPMNGALMPVPRAPRMA